MSSSERFGGFGRSFKGARTSLRLGVRLDVRFVACLLLFASANALCGCVMSEEMKRITAQKKADAQRQESGSTNLTGEQIFVRTCNTCHPQGRQGMGPSLENLTKDFPEDGALKAYIRKGKGIMPGQPKEVLNDQEMDNLVGYLRALTFEK